MKTNKVTYIDHLTRSEKNEILDVFKRTKGTMSFSERTTHLKEYMTKNMPHISWKVGYNLALAQKAGRYDLL